MQEISDEVYKDRLQALREGGQEGLENAMARLPMLADAVAGDGPLAVRPSYFGLTWGSGQALTTTTDVARVMAANLTMQVAVMSSTKIEHQLLGLAAWKGGTLDRDETIADTGADPDALDEAAAGLHAMFLSDRSRGWVALRPGVADWSNLPGVPVREGSEMYTSDWIAGRLRQLGVQAGSRKWERVNALENALRDIDVVEAAVEALDPEAQDVFNRLARRGFAPISELDVGGMYSSNNPLHRLHAAGLIGLQTYEAMAWVWLDVLVALNGSLYRDWTVPSPDPLPLTAMPAERVPSVVGRLDQLLDRWAVSPPRALKSGGMGVKPVRAAAKALGSPSPEIGLVAALAIELGLLAPVVTATRGRGRNATVDEEWRPTERRATWASEPAGRRWAALVQQWLDSGQLEATGKAIERHEPGTPMLARPLSRISYLATLSTLEEGTGLGKDDLTAWLLFRLPSLMAPAIVDQLTDEARALGLVPSDGPVGLTPVGRRLLNGVDQLELLTEGAADHFTVQGDHTVIGPPDLDPDIAADLERFTRLESEAGARIYRIDTENVLRALDDGWSLEDIFTFLAQHSTAPVAQNVERTIRDAAERHGRLVVGSATTWVTSDDPTFLAQAVAVKPAKLELVSPTLAVSELASDKVAEALRRKGLAPREHAEQKPPAPVRSRVAAKQVALRDQPLRSRKEIARLAGSLVEGEAPPVIPEDEIDWEAELSQLFEMEE